MLSWITRCCSTGNSCPFQKALDNCTYADWNAPNQNDMAYVIDCFHGEHKQTIRSQKAFFIFKSKFENHDDRNITCFRLKNLLMLDRCTENKCVLDLIANYEYNRLFYDRNKLDPSVENKALQQFIYAYFLYIRKKGDIYQRFPDELFQHKTRKSYINNANNLGRLFEFIDFTLQIQKLLNQSNQTLKKVNKSPVLIQQILICMLKTYIFLYTIVAICLQTLLGKLKNLKFTQLNNLDRLLKYFSKEYSNAFLNFLEANKTISAFKNIQYNEIIKIDQTYLVLFEKYYKIKASESSNPLIQGVSSEKSISAISTPTTIKSDFRYSIELQDSIQELPSEVTSKLTDQIKFSYEPRNVIQEVTSSDAHLFTMAFLQYKNYYSEDFIQQYKKDEVKDLSSSQTLNSNVLELPMKKTKSSKIMKKKSIMEDLINSKNLKRQSIHQNRAARNFKQAVWITWQNIYSQND